MIRIAAGIFALYMAGTAPVYSGTLDCSGLVSDDIGDASSWPETDIQCAGVQILGDNALFSVAFAGGFSKDFTLAGFSLDADQDASTGSTFSLSDLGTEYTVEADRFVSPFIQPSITVSDSDGGFGTRLFPDDIAPVYFDNGMQLTVPLDQFALSPDWNFEVYSQRRTSVGVSSTFGVSDILKGSGDAFLVSTSGEVSPDKAEVSAPATLALFGMGFLGLRLRRTA